MAMRLAFMGTPAFSVPVLQALVEVGHEIAAVYSQPPRPSGRRGRVVLPSPVQQAAQDLGLPVFTPPSLREPLVQQHFLDLQLDTAIVVAYGLLLPPAILAAPKWGCYNAHASLLPRWRGAAPIQRAIMAGDKETGLMIMKMDEGLDSGPVALSQKIPINHDTTAHILHDQLAQIAASLMVEALTKLEKNSLNLTPQPQDGVTYADKITKLETRIDWSKPARDIDAMIRALTPFPGAWCEMEIAGQRERVKILGSRLELSNEGAGGDFDVKNLIVHCAGGEVHLTKLQKAGGKTLSAEEFQRGHPVTAIF